MRIALLPLAVALFCLAAASARAETLSNLVESEQGVAFGTCALTPKPAIPGEVHVVIPARFETPGVWVTRTILLVGIDSGKTVEGLIDLTVADDLPPREVISVTCKGNRLTVRLRAKTLLYTFDGKALRKAGK